jgi:hypothetical protein
MKKIFVLAVFLVVIGVLCAVFFLRDKPREDTGKKPWTVGAQTLVTETTEAQTTGYADAVEAYSDFVHTQLREDYGFLSKEDETYDAAGLTDSLLSVYIYDMDTDCAEEMSIVRTREKGVTRDVYEYRGGKVRFADSATLALDPMNDVSLSLTDASLRHVQARLVIYPSGADRFFCLTVEQQNAAGEYDAYTVVMEYAKEKLKVKKSFRLRQTGEVVTLMCTDNVTLLYRQAAQQPTEAETDVSLAQYDNLQKAFETEFGKLGLNAPQVAAEKGRLTQYKVTAVDSEQHLFDVTLDGGQIRVTENGFLQSFILRR